MIAAKPRIWLANQLAKGVVPVGEPAISTKGLADLVQSLQSQNAVLGPGIPVAPVHTEEGQPRRWDYMPGTNIVTKPRSYEAYTFETLRTFCRNYDVANLCIEKRKDDMRGLIPQIRPRPVDGMTRAERKDQRNRLEDAINECTGFMLSPDQEHMWAPWLVEWAGDLFETDSATIYLRPTLDGSLYALEVIDGTTLRPLIDTYGRPPAPPEPAWVQMIRGVPWGWYTSEEIIQQPYWPRSDSPYGHPPIEWVLMAANRALRRQTRDLANFTDGNMPAGLLSVPESWNMTQIKELREYLDELLAGNDKARSRMVPVPGMGSSNPFQKMTEEPSTEGEEWLLYLTCWAFGVSPSEIGYSKSGSGLGGKGFAEVQQDLSFRRSVKNPGLHLKGILDAIIARVPAWAELEVHFPGLEDVGDSVAKAEAAKVYVDMGARSVDDVAENDLDLDPPGVSNYVMTTAGPVLTTTLMAGVNTDGTGSPSLMAPAAPSAEPGQLTEDVSAGSVAKRSADADLDAWKRKAVKSIKAGKQAGVPFVSDAIPADIASGVRLTLSKASTLADVHAVFDLAKAGASASPLPAPPSKPSSKPSSPASTVTRKPLSYRGWTA
jgi:phage portal protein BeeE